MPVRQDRGIKTPDQYRRAKQELSRKRREATIYEQQMTALGYPEEGKDFRKTFEELENLVRDYEVQVGIPTSRRVTQ